MILANALRLGNWVQLINNIDDWQLVEAIVPMSNTENGIHLVGNALYNLPEQLKGVALTTDILIQCGFTKRIVNASDPTKGYWYELAFMEDKFKHEFEDLSLVCNGEINGDLSVVLAPYDQYFTIEYLHELQNLYFALTRKELVIKF